MTVGILSDMISNIGKQWLAWSKSNPKFDIRGYTKGGKDYQNDAINAMQMLSKVMRQPIPKDVELTVISTDQ